MRISQNNYRLVDKFNRIVNEKIGENAVFSGGFATRTGRGIVVKNSRVTKNMFEAKKAVHAKTQLTNPGRGYMRFNKA